MLANQSITDDGIRMADTFESAENILMMSAITPTVKSPAPAWGGFLKKPFSLHQLLQHVHALAPQDKDQEEPR